jgi:hypothetical protein
MLASEESPTFTKGDLIEYEPNRTNENLYLAESVDVAKLK